MTIRRLRELIADLPDDARIYLDDGTSMFEGNSEVILVGAYAPPYDKMVLLQTRNDVDVSQELEARANWYSEHWDEVGEVDYWLELSEDGFTPDDFDEDEREHAILNFENYGLI